MLSTRDTAGRLLIKLDSGSVASGEWDTIGANVLNFGNEIVMADGGRIGNSAATARLGFDSSGATDYAYFMGCHLGIGTITPMALVTLYDIANRLTVLALDTPGTSNAQGSGINLHTLGDGTKALGAAGTQGWLFTARGDAFAVAAQQNDLLLSYWTGAAWQNKISVEHDTGYFGVGTMTSLEASLDVDGAIQSRQNRAGGKVGYFRLGSAGGAEMIPLIHGLSENASFGLYLLARPEAAAQTGFTSAAFYLNARDNANDPLTTGNLFQLANDGAAKVTVDKDGDAGIGTVVPDRLVHGEVSDAATNAISYANRWSHALTAGAAAALFGVGQEHELEDAGGAMQVASETVTLWAAATAGAESPLFRGTTYPIGVAGPGYWGFWTWNDLDNNARTIVPNGAGDVTSGVTIMYRLSESGGGVDGNVVMVANGGSVNLYDDGTDVCTLTVNADGSVTVVRSAGAATFDVSLLMTWL